MRRCLPLLALVVLVLASGGCGGVRVVDAPIPADYAWPPGDPRVALERVVQLRRGRGIFGGGTGSPLFDRPQSVAWQGGDLLVADPAARRIVRIGADGRVSESAADSDFAPLGLAACPDGLVATDPARGAVALVGRDLRRARWLAEGLDRPTGVACSDEGVVYVVETGAHRVLALAPDGSRRSFGGRGTGPGEFNFPTALAWHAGELLVGDTLNFRIQRLDAETGAALGDFGRLGDAAGDTPRIKGVAVDAAGHLWVSDAHVDRVSLYTDDGDLLMSLGQRGSRPGDFSLPSGIAAHPDGRVAVADALNRRVQVFRLLPSAPEAR